MWRLRTSMKHKHDAHLEDMVTVAMKGIWIPLGLPYIGINGTPMPSMCEFIVKEVISVGTQTELPDKAQVIPKAWPTPFGQAVGIANATHICQARGIVRKSPIGLAEDIAHASLAREEGAPQDCHVNLEKSITRASPVGKEASFAQTFTDHMDEEEEDITNVSLDKLNEEKDLMVPVEGFRDVSRRKDLVAKQKDSTAQGPPIEKRSVLETEPQTVLDTEQMTPADYNSRQEAENIVLKMWTIAPFGDSAVSLKGKRMDLKWHSNVVVQRLSSRKLKTKSGAIYSIKGPPSFPDEKFSEFPRAVYRKFLHGFPDNWVEVLTQHFAAQKTNTRKSREEPLTKDKAPEIRTASINARQLPAEEAVPCTRSGRHVRPPLEYWRGEHLVTDPKTGNVHVMAGGCDYLLSHSITTPSHTVMWKQFEELEVNKENKAHKKPKPSSTKALKPPIDPSTSRDSYNNQRIVPKPTKKRLTEARMVLDLLLQNLSKANETESHVERGSTDSAASSGGKAARRDSGSVKLISHTTRTLEHSQLEHKEVVLQHSKSNHALTLQDSTGLVMNMQECAEMMDGEESANPGIVQKAKRFKRMTLSSSSSIDATTKKVGVPREQQRLQSEGRSPSGGSSVKPCQLPCRHKITGNERDQGLPHSNSSSKECLVRSKRLRTRSERAALHLSARTAPEAVAMSTRNRTRQMGSTETVCVKPNMDSATYAGVTDVCYSPQLPFTSADLHKKTAIDNLIFAEITESEYDLHFHCAKGDKDLSE